MNKNKQPIKKLGIGKKIIAGAAFTLAGALAPHEAASAQDAKPSSTEQSTEASTTSTSSTSTTSTTEVPTTSTTEQQSTTTTTAQETGQEPLVCDPQTNTKVPTGDVDPATGNPVYNIYDKDGKFCGQVVDSPILTQEPPAEVQGTKVEQLPRTGNSSGELGLLSAGLIAAGAGSVAMAEAAKRRHDQTPNS